MNIRALTITLSSHSGEELQEEDIGEDFDILVEVLLYEEERETNSLYFQFAATSPSKIGSRPSNSFISPTLLLSELSLDEIRRHIERLLMQVKSCKSWECVAFRLAPFMAAVSPYDWRL